ncbi:MAG: O-antigen ligase family protein [Acidobacteriota bacterium]
MTTASMLGILMWFIGVPLITGLLFSQPRWRRPMLSIMAFFTCLITKPFYQEVFFVNYRGVDRGFGVTVPDLFFLSFFVFTILGGTKKKIIWVPYNTTLFVVLLIISAISLIGTPVAYFGLFTLHKFIRGYILFWVIVNIIKEREDVEAVISGVIAAVVFQGINVIWAKYITKAVVNRSTGSFPHPNSLAMYIDLIIPSALALYLSGTLTKKKNYLAILAILLGVVSVIFTKSRAGLIIMFGSLSLVVAISVLMKPTARKFGVVALGVVAMAIIGTMAAPKIIQRFENAPKESEATREYFNTAADAMMKDKFFGVGLNAYSWTLANTDYYWYVYPDKIDLQDPEAFRESKQGESRLGTCHHIYRLYGAEIGQFGMFVFIAYLAAFYIRNLFLFFKSQDDFYKAILLGLLIGFATLHLQGLLEWIFRQTQVYYLFLLLSGLMVAIGNIIAPKKIPAYQSANAN